MLVLSRKEGQTIVIGDGIEIQVTAIQGNRVKIAVAAPRNVRVMRGELAESALVDARRPETNERIRPVAASHCV